MKEVLLCSTLNKESSKFIIKGLENRGISYLQRWEEISVFKRKKYNNEKEICRIFINTGQKQEAIQYLESLSKEELINIIIEK